jgi:small neutral amino acid transporter SnatA (MarC family)
MYFFSFVWFTELDRANLLAVFFLGIALFAGLASFGGFDTAFVSAFFAGGLGLFAAGFGLGQAHAGEKSYRAGNSDD